MNASRVKRISTPRSVLLAALALLISSSPLAAETVRQQEQREASQRQVEIRMNEFRERMRNLRIDSAVLQEDARAELRRLTGELNAKQELAERKLSELRAAGSLNWEQYRAQANAAIDDLNRVYDRIRSLTK